MRFLLTIFLYLPSCVHSSPKRGRFRSGLWRGGGGGACAGGVPLRRPGRPPESGLRRLGAFARGCELARPGLRRGRVRERHKARRRRAFPHGPERATGSVGRGVQPSGFAGRGTFIRAGAQGQPCGPELDETTAQRDRDTPSERMERPRPGDRRGNLPPWDRWGNSPDAGRTLRAGEQDGSAQNRRARSAGSSPIAYLKHRRPGAPRPLGFHLPHTPGDQPRERRGLRGRRPTPGAAAASSTTPSS